MPHWQPCDLYAGICFFLCVSQPLLKNNQMGSYSTHAYPAPYPEDTRSRSKRWFFKPSGGVASHAAVALPQATGAEPEPAAAASPASPARPRSPSRTTFGRVKVVDYKQELKLPARAASLQPKQARLGTLVVARFRCQQCRAATSVSGGVLRAGWRSTQEESGLRSSGYLPRATENKTSVMIKE